MQTVTKSITMFEKLNFTLVFYSSVKSDRSALIRTFIYGDQYPICILPVDKELIKEIPEEITAKMIIKPEDIDKMFFCYGYLENEKD